VVLIAAGPRGEIELSDHDHIDAQVESGVFRVFKVV
jgi:hypothetical protein